MTDPEVLASGRVAGRYTLSVMSQNPHRSGARGLAILVRRSDAPLAPPNERVGVPIRVEGLGVVAGGFLGMVFSPLLTLAPLFDPLPRETRGWLFPIVGAALGAGLGALLSRRPARTIVFDADGIWEEGPEGATDPLPWPGLRLREGRTPRLVAEDGRSLVYPDSAIRQARGPDPRYLDALVRALPRETPPPRLPRLFFVPLFAAGAASFALAVPRVVTPRGEEPTVPPFSPLWFAWLTLLIFGVAALVVAVIGGLLRIEGGMSPPPPPEDEDGIGALFRASRFRPAPVEIVPGTLYRYRNEAFWRAAEREARSARWTLGLMGVALFTLTPFISRLPPRPNESPANARLLPILGILNLVVLGGTALLARPPRRAGLRLRVEGDRALIAFGDGPERTYAWPPTRTRAATGLLDWTDELAAGRHRLRVDRRLLVAVGEGREFRASNFLP